VRKVPANVYLGKFKFDEGTGKHMFREMKASLGYLKTFFREPNHDIGGRYVCRGTVLIISVDIK
jgi:hypothetical protein